jgi:hypothetical protein
VATTLARRLEKLEATAQHAAQQRWREALRQLYGTMAPKHIALFREWMQQCCGGQMIPIRSGETWPSLLARLQLSALVRAAWVLMSHHMVVGAPVALPAQVAKVYLQDPDAWPTNACAGCHYLLPTRSTLRRDGSFDHIATYEGECPFCGLDNHPQEESLWRAGYLIRPSSPGLRQPAIRTWRAENEMLTL